MQNICQAGRETILEISSGLNLFWSLRNSELALDIALHDAGMLLRVDLAEDGTVGYVELNITAIM